MSTKENAFDPLAALMGSAEQAPARQVRPKKEKPMAKNTSEKKDLKKFMLTIPVDLHAALRLRAAADGDPMNRWVVNLFEKALADDVEYVRASREKKS